ncbi:MAG: T9SS type A sorting domain-containing protein [Balneola sp.]
MKKTLQSILAITLLGLTVIMVGLFLTNQKDTINNQIGNFVSGEEKTINDRAENSKDRQDHFFRLMRDPATNKIPDNIRAKELEFAHKLDASQRFKSSQASEEINIVEAGPNDVGGRTRGLGIDSRDSDIILAGGASGGMWKSIDGGDSWTQTSDLGQNLGVTSLVQDPNNLNTWYYSTGEFNGASSRARGGGGQLYGSGIYTSNDNGDSWTQIQATADNDVTFNSEFDYISRVEISPTTGTAFFASNGDGIYRSTNQFNANTLVLGGVNQHIYSDVQVASNGNVVAVISAPFSGQTQSNPSGVYISSDDGLTWTNVTPNSYPSNPGRGVLGLSQSDPVFYVFVADNSSQASLYAFDTSDINNVTSEDRTDNIPNFGAPVGDLNLQGGYNMVCEVHPTDPDIVVIGGTNLFRSEDGFTTTPDDDDSNGITDSNEKSDYWIGGYSKANNIAQYTNHHPDQHAVVFDPNDSNRIFSSHDGGISVADDITSFSILWDDLNNGYNVTQFYTVSLHPDAGDDRIIGGTQDNGSPYFKYNSITGTTTSDDASSGDGAYQYLGTNYMTTSSQRGRLIQYDYTLLGDPTNFSYITPLAASNQLFIHPYLVNHNDEDIIFYPSGRDLFRNDMGTTLANNQDNPDGINEGWTELSNLDTDPGSLISTLAITTTNPSDVLYYASYSENDAPKIYKLNNASTATETSDLTVIEITAENSTSVPPQGAYIHDIAISEDNGNELIVVISNYSTESVYYTSDGGSSWTGIGGNLEPANGNGPSVRTAAITKTSNGEKTYYVGTSTGLYATNTLDDENTVWKFQGASTIGNTVIEYLDYRKSDQTLAIATHGRGIFIGNVSTSVSNEGNIVSNTPAKFNLEQNYPNPFNPSTSISYSLPTSSNVTISVYDISGRKVSTLLSNQSTSAGTHQINFDATNLASGIYLYRIDANSVAENRSFTQIKRMTLIK